MTFELVPDRPHAPCAICQGMTTNRYRLDPEHLMIACSQLHAQRLYLRIYSAPEPVAITAGTPSRNPSRRTFQQYEAGHRFNESHLTYIGFVEFRGYSRYDRFRCDCGNVVVKAMGNVKSGAVTCCGYACSLTKSKRRAA